MESEFGKEVLLNDVSESATGESTLLESGEIVAEIEENLVEEFYWEEVRDGHGWGRERGLNVVGMEQVWPRMLRSCCDSG